MVTKKPSTAYGTRVVAPETCVPVCGDDGIATAQGEAGGHEENPGPAFQGSIQFEEGDESGEVDITSRCRQDRDHPEQDKLVRLEPVSIHEAVGLQADSENHLRIANGA